MEVPPPPLPCKAPRTKRRWKALWGACCSAGGKHSERSVPHSHGHHSLYVQPEVTDTTHSGIAVVYRPPHLNQRLAPGESRPRFWISPSPGNSAPAVVSVAWCEVCQPQHNNLHRLTNYTLKPKHRTQTTATMDEDCMEGGKGKCITGSISQSPSNAMDSGDNNRMVVKAYPTFLLPYVNKRVRLRLVFTDANTKRVIGEHGHLRHEADGGEMEETAHMVRGVHSLRLEVKYSTIVPGLPEVVVEENHGGSKRLKKLRYRHMPVRWIDLDHRQPKVIIVGEAFQLSLVPPSASLKPKDFPDGNGEIPSVMGTYTRTLDTSPDRQLEFGVRLYQWYNNQDTPSVTGSESSNVDPDIHTGGSPYSHCRAAAERSVFGGRSKPCFANYNKS